MAKKLCKKLDTCYKIMMILDKDLLDMQYAILIRKVCLKCSGEEKDNG